MAIQQARGRFGPPVRQRNLDAKKYSNVCTRCSFHFKVDGRQIVLFASEPVMGVVLYSIALERCPSMDPIDGAENVFGSR